MRNKETGEFELVVGNGFLVSGFFIVILLFAVGVAMGYILGKNSEKSAQAQTASTTPCAATDTRPQPTPAAQTADAQPTPASDQPSTATQPASQPEPTPVTQPAKQETPPPPPPPKETPRPAPAAASELPSGFFWQVTASANMEAVRATRETLAKKGFSAYLEPGPNNLTRVIVGPYADTASRAKAKTELEAITGKSPVAHPR